MKANKVHYIIPATLVTHSANTHSFGGWFVHCELVACNMLVSMIKDHKLCIKSFCWNISSHCKYEVNLLQNLKAS